MRAVRELLEDFVSRLEVDLKTRPFWLFREDDVRQCFVDAYAARERGAWSVRGAGFEVAWPGLSRGRALDLQLQIAGRDLAIEFKHWNAVIKLAHHGGLSVRNPGDAARRAKLDSCLEDAERLSALGPLTPNRASPPIALLVVTGQASSEIESTQLGPFTSMARRPPPSIFEPPRGRVSGRTAREEFSALLRGNAVPRNAWHTSPLYRKAHLDVCLRKTALQCAAGTRFSVVVLECGSPR